MLVTGSLLVLNHYFAAFIPSGHLLTVGALICCQDIIEGLSALLLDNLEVSLLLQQCFVQVVNGTLLLLVFVLLGESSEVVWRAGALSRVETSRLFGVQ